MLRKGEIVERCNDDCYTISPFNHEYEKNIENSIDHRSTITPFSQTATRSQQIPILKYISIATE